MIINHLILSGVVCKTPFHKISPSGIPHCQFIFEHCSIQNEAGFNRQAWCRIPVIVSGYENQSITHNIMVGNFMTIQGFISCHKATTGLTKIVLHAKKIELI